MTLRKAHGTGAGALVRVETLPADELPLGVQEKPLEPARDERRADGTFRPGARTIQAAGGRATAGKTKLSVKLGLTFPDDAAFAPYQKAAKTFRRVQCSKLAQSVGGGVCGPGPSSIVASAALALAWSRFFSDEAARTRDPDFAMRSARLGETSRQHLLAAHELCAREAIAREASKARAPDAIPVGFEPVESDGK